MILPRLGRRAAGRQIAAALATVALGLLPGRPAAAQPAPVDESLILGVTIDLQRTGLLDVLLPVFEQQTGRTVTVVAVSAPHALALGVRAELDVLLVNAGDDEAPFMAAGHAISRQLVMHADEVIVGPRSDPAGLRQSTGLEDGLRRLAQSGSTWISRADNSALYQDEKRLWRDAGVETAGQPWYVAFGQGMLPTLAAATERQAYTLVDRQTFLERHSTLDLNIQLQGAPDLLRLYHVIVANPAKGAWIDDTGARTFADFVLSAEAQAVIGSYGEQRLGQAVFVPDAGRTEQELRPDRRAAG
ncbi:MAG: substrate-binding domain-containing protein [Chloroflexota bacterium]